MRVRLRESEPEPGRPAKAKANQTESPNVQRQDEPGREAVMGLQRSAGNAGVAELMAEEGDERAMVEQAIRSAGRLRARHGGTWNPQCAPISATCGCTLTPPRPLRRKPSMRPPTPSAMTWSCKAIDTRPRRPPA